MALLLAIVPAGAFGSVWTADNDVVRAGHETPPGPYDPNYDPEAYWDYFTKGVLEQLNKTYNPGVDFSIDYLNCAEILTMLLDITDQQAALLCSNDPDERKEGIMSVWGLSALGGWFEAFSAMLTDTNRAAADATVIFQSAPFIIEDYDGYAPADLALYKLFNDGSTLPFVGYASSPTANTDGYWCLMTVNSAYVGMNQLLNEDGAYVVRYWIKNNGSYDQDPSNNIVLDPVALAFKAAGGGDDGDGGGGCVLNAAAGLSLEWLFVMLAPAILFFRRRK